MRLGGPKPYGWPRYLPSLGIAVTAEGPIRVIFWCHWTPDILVPVDSPLLHGVAA